MSPEELAEEQALEDVRNKKHRDEELDDVITILRVVRYNIHDLQKNIKELEYKIESLC